ncbi:MAG: RecQ family zinc-binding domain-containing protein, partial [Roseateles sp.]|uniref:RecQ family zinc-binding domain-containing protein n=1 Tax=Roseateles sp. TaxID=1971397 RepID=UPI004036C3F8
GLSAMVLYAKAGGCRWAGVLAHYGEALEAEARRCGHCDSCARFERLLAAERNAPATETEPPPVAAAAFAPGQRVRVRRFGWGEVRACTAEMVRIDFPRHGQRDIHPDFVLATARG